jgi:Fe-Mn family superoxide dismutase
MEQRNFYTQPPLAHDYKALVPHISEEQLKIHYEKHHQAYIKGAKAIFEKLDKAHKDNVDLDMKSTLKELSFNIGGYILHSLFWGNLAPYGQYDKPSGMLGNKINEEFGSFERFKKEFTQAALSVEGSGWAALAYCRRTERPLIMQIEKHNVNVYPMLRIILVLDVFEHAYYIDYKNDRARFIDAFWNIVNWDEPGKRLEEIIKV